jgi:S1-C subfamily serine protease
MRHNTFAAAVTLLLCFAVARADEVSEKGRDVLKKYQRAVVTVQVVLKVTGSGGRGSELKQEITGTVINPNGLTVVALSACDPTELNRRLSEDYKVETEVTDVKFLMEDGGELPAEISLRDRDLDLAFIRPKAKPASPMTAVDLAQSAPAQVLDQVISLNRLNRAASRAYSASVERISAVVQKPRTFYIPDSTMSATGLGSPVFALNGNVIGLVVMRAVSNRGGGNSRDGYTSIILPAEDILKGAKEAPEVKPEETKPEGAKEPAAAK